MHNSKIKQITLAVWLAMAPFAADAAGLGKLTVISGLGEPLNAEIELVSATKEELSSLTAKIASPEVYEQQGIERPAGLVGIKVDLGKQADGTPVLKISSPSPMNDPYLDMLIQVDWGTGRLMRQYTALLDPPGYNNDQSLNSGTAVAKTNRPSVSSSSAGASSASSGKASKRSKKVKPQADQSPATETSSEKPSESSAQGDYTTKRGDTLRAVASQMHVEGVSLEQMLVGIYQANKSAFAGDNMNRLKVGQVLRAPTQDELQGISKQDAQKEIQVQTQDWNAYRHKLAEGVAEAPPARDEESAQSASGKVTTSAQEKGVKPDAAPKDVVKLSKNDVAGKATAKGDSKAAEAASSEDKIAKEKADKEANARVTELEKQIQDMQKLLEVKNKAIADQQAKTATPVVDAAKPAEVTKPVEASKPVEAAKPAEAPKVAEVPKAVEAPKPIVKPKPAYVPPPAPEPSLVDDILQDPIKLGGVGAGLIALLGGGFLLMRNKRRKSLDSFEQGILTTGGLKPNTVFGNTAGGTVDTGDSSFLADFTQGSSVGMIDTNDVDPVAEAEVYMAYGRDAQAEEILKDALLKEPKRYELHHKLLEIYSNRKDTAAFETLAGEMYSALDSSDPVWQKVAEMGRKLEPENPLYAEQSGGVSVPVAIAVDALSETKLNEEESFPSIAAADEDSSMDLGFSGVQDEGEATLDFSIDTLSGVQSSELTGNDAPAVDDNSLDFDLGGFDASPEAPLTTKTEGDVPDFESSLNPLADIPEVTPAIADDNSLDISFDTPELAADEPVPTSEVEDLGFDLDLGGELAETPPTAEANNDLVLDDLDSFNLDSTIVTDTDKLSETDTPALPDEPVSAAVQEEEISFDLPDMVPEVAADAEEAISLDIPEDAPSVAMDLELPDFELGENVVESLDETMIMNTPPKLEAPEESLVLDDAGTEALDLNFDVDLGDTPEVIEETSAAATEVPDLDLSGISLDLADTGLPTEFPDTDDEPEEIVLSDVESPDVDTKLDLVTAYIDMGDTEGARELLDEVLKEGGTQQRERAQSILATLT